MRVGAKTLVLVGIISITLMNPSGAAPPEGDSAAITASPAEVAPLPRVFLLDAKRLQASRQKISAQDPAVSAGLAQLERDAKRALTAGPFSVVEKDATPPSGD